MFSLCFYLSVLFSAVGLTVCDCVLPDIGAYMGEESSSLYYAICYFATIFGFEGG